MDTSIQIFEIPKIRYTPELVAWLVGIFLAVLMVRRDGGRAEKLFLAGCSLMFAVELATPLLSELVQGLVKEQDMSFLATARTMSLAVSLPMGILSLAAMVCLIWAYWLRFQARRQEPA